MGGGGGGGSLEGGEEGRMGDDSMASHIRDDRRGVDGDSVGASASSSRVARTVNVVDLCSRRDATYSSRGRAWRSACFVGALVL